MLLQRTLLQVPLLKKAILDDVQITFKFDNKGNLIPGDYLVCTRRSDNLPEQIKGRAIYHEWQYTAANSYEVTYKGETREVEFINRHWYWLDWDEDKEKYRAYTVDPTSNWIIAPGEYGLGTEEVLYQEREDSASEDTSKGENSGSDSDGASQDDERTLAASLPIQELARTHATRTVEEETVDLVKVTATLSIQTPPISVMSGSATIAWAGGSRQIHAIVPQPQAPAPHPPAPQPGAPAPGGGVPGGGGSAPGGKGGGRGGGPQPPAGGGANPPQQ